MKKMILILLSIVLFIVMFFKLFVIIGDGCNPPDKPISVPENAVWKGDCDGGSWIEMVSVSNDEVRFRIYADWNGELIVDADFIYNNCDNLRLTKSNWINHIAYYEDALVMYENSSEDILCRLEPKYNTTIHLDSGSRASVDYDTAVIDTSLKQ